MSNWTAEEVESAARLWREGSSQSAIAKALNRSIGSVAGKIHGSAWRKPIGQKRGPQRPPLSSRTIRERRESFRKEKTAVPKPEPIAPLNIPFWDIRLGECRAITDSTRDAQRCCGHPVDERGTYCAAHRALFYTQSKGKSA